MVNRFFPTEARKSLAVPWKTRYNPYPMCDATPNSEPRKNTFPRLLLLCLALSLALHLITILTLSRLDLATKPNALQKSPTFVRLVDPPATEKPLAPAPEPVKERTREFEVDQPPLPEESPRPEVPSRSAEQNRIVPREQAPRGIDNRDQAVGQIVPQDAPPATPVTPLEPESPVPMVKQNIEKAPSTKKNLEKSETGQMRPSTTPEPSAPEQSRSLPSLEQLTSLPPETLDRMARRGTPREMHKQRDDVEIGDEVWLNLEHDLLTSFFRRFRNQIEGVWNYPTKAAQNGIQGDLLLKITVNTKGELLDVDLLETSSSDLLDFEAIQAVYRAAPFGPLPKQYPHPELKIFAHFRYLLVGKYIYGR